MIIKQQQGFVEENMSNLTCGASGDQASVSSTNNNRVDHHQPSNSLLPHQQHYFPQQNQSQDQEEQPQLPPAKKKRNLPGNPDPEAEVIALSPKSLLATNRFVCEICNKGFQRDQNLQLHRRGHNLPWKLKQRNNKEVVRKKVYVCPEPSCVHHDPSRALGDLTGIKKHFCRKHGEKKWKCEKCSKRYAVQSDWKAHSKVCGTREYRCDCGTLFSRRDSFITHRAFCDALAEETARSITTNSLLSNPIAGPSPSQLIINLQQQQHSQLINNTQHDPLHSFPLKREQHQQPNLITTLPPWLSCPSSSLVGPSSTPTIDHHHQNPHLSSPSSSSSSIFHQDHVPNPNTNMGGPTIGAGPYHTQTVSPHMSATALLQKAAQMGATISKTVSSSTAQPHPHPLGHVSDTTPPPTTTSTAGLFGLNLSSRDPHQDIIPSPPIGPTPGPGPAQSSFLHDLMMNSISSSYDHHHAFGIGGGDAKGSGSEGMTRDFLGLRPLSHNEILTIAGLGNCLNTNSASHDDHGHHHQQHDDAHKQPWQG